MCTKITKFKVGRPICHLSYSHFPQRPHVYKAKFCLDFKWLLRTGFAVRDNDVCGEHVRHAKDSNGWDL